MMGPGGGPRGLSRAFAGSIFQHTPILPKVRQHSVSIRPAYLSIAVTCVFCGPMSVASGSPFAAYMQPVAYLQIEVSRGVRLLCF